MAILALVITFVVSLVITPFVKRFAFKIGAVDQPNNRKVHTKVMPRLGGLAIVISFFLGISLFLPDTIKAWPVLVGALVIVVIGFIDDLKEISPRIKLMGQLVAAIVTVFGGIQIEYITLPSGEILNFGYFAIPITIIWIVGITNAINLIDGLDGLAAGVSSIALLTISGLALSMGNPLVALLSLLVLGSTMGFLVFNFHPAKIFMGDSGSLFLGYMISVLAIMGLFKNVAIFSLIVPIIAIGVPIIDTGFAIIRRIVKKMPLSSPDKLHLHHCLIRLGFSHKQTVILIYVLSALFGVFAMVFTRATLWGSTLLLIGILILVELIVEVTGLISDKYRPLLHLIDGRKK